MQDHNQQFIEILDKLNPKQLEAVETIEGPVIVVAGPGTGKTQILAARIGKILLETHAEPHNILCLTYTEAGAIAMRKRLFEFIGKAAYRVNISTFHGFCNSVIQDNPDLFGNRQLEPISDIEEVELYRELINSFDAKHPLKRFTGDVYYEKKALSNLFQLMKKENWQPDFICKKADEYIADLPLRDEYTYKKSGKGYKAGELKQNKIDEETEKMNKLKAAVNEYPKYQAIMTARNRYDFNDMILWVLDIFKNNPNILLGYQERYQYVLVDEYQDTSGSQNELLKMLIAFWESPNVFVVGDDDQSIYRFQGANVENIISFINSYKEDAKIIMLTENYRSVQSILDVAGTLIDNNTERLTKQIDGLSKDLVASNIALQNLGVRPEIREYPNDMHETVAIAKEIEQAHIEGFDLNEIAVIYRNHKQAEGIVKYLQQKGIPLNTRRKINILELPFIQNLLDILRYVNAETERVHSGELYLFKILHFDFFQVNPLDVAMLSIEVSRKNFMERNLYWREQLKKIVSKQKSDLFDNNIESIQAMKRLSDDIEYWIKSTVNETLQNLLERIVTRGGVLNYIMHHPDKIWLMQVLTTFFNFVKEESAKNPKIKISDFLKTITLMEENGIALELNKIMQDTAGVNFVTAHSSKGLEYERVYMLGCTAKTWEKSSRSDTYKLPDTMITINKGDDKEEDRRLFYVAVTRAKKELYISYPAATNDDKPLKSCIFVAEIADGAKIDIQEKRVENEDLMEFQFMNLGEQKVPDLELLDKNYINALLDTYSLSVTNLNNYLRCPVSFYFNNLLKVPAAKNEYMAFGTAVHGALDRLFKKMLKHETLQFPGQDVFLDDFYWYMQRNEDSFTQEQYKRRIEYGREILPAFYDKYINDWSKNIKTEESFRNIEMDGIPLSGKLDKLELNENTVNVIDYKTGKYDNAKKKMSPPLEIFDPVNAKFEEKHGGDYWRQAVFYKILVESDKTRNWQVISTEFDFVEPDKKSKDYIKHKIVITPQDVNIVKNQIKQAYTGIKNHEFSRGCNEEDCVWCNFVKQTAKNKPIESGLSVSEDGN